YVPRLAKGLVEEADELVSRIVTGKIPEDTPVMGGTANVVTSLLFYLKSQGDDERDVEDGCGEGEDDFCCYASTPSGSGVPAVEGGEVSAFRRVAGSVFAKREELTAVVAGDGEKEEEDVELLTEIICLVMTAMTACSNEIVSTEDGRPTKLVGQDFLVAALEALVKAMQQLGEEEVLVESLLHEKQAVEKCLAGEGGRPMGCRPQIAEILLSIEERSKEAPMMSAAVKLESPAAEAYLSRWRLCRGMKLDLGGTIAVPRSVEEKAADDTGRSGASPSSSSLPPIISSTTATPSTGGMLGDDSLDSPEFFQAGSHHDTAWSPTGRSPTPEWPGPVPTDWAESPDDQAWVASPTVSDVKWGSSTPVGWPTEDGSSGQLDGDTVEGRNMNESIDLVDGDSSESPRGNAARRDNNNSGGGGGPHHHQQQQLLSMPSGAYGGAPQHHQQQQQRRPESKGFFGNLFQSPSAAAAPPQTPPTTSSILGRAPLSPAPRDYQQHQHQQQHGGRNNGGRNARRSQTPPQRRQQQQQQQQRTPPQSDREPGDEDLHNVLRSVLV
ncbi:hypothetical protein FOZ62_030605, partial [Perkinsus olseni]